MSNMVTQWSAFECVATQWHKIIPFLWWNTTVAASCYGLLCSTLKELGDMETKPKIQEECNRKLPSQWALTQSRATVHLSAEQWPDACSKNNKWSCFGATAKFWLEPHQTSVETPDDHNLQMFCSKSVGAWEIHAKIFAKHTREEKQVEVFIIRSLINIKVT